MSDAWGFENDDDQQEHGPKALRDAYEAQKRMNRELQESLQNIQNELKNQKLEGVFKELGVPAAKELYQGEADPEKAKAWVESMRGVFGGQPGAVTPQTPPPAPSISSEQQQAYQRMTEAGSMGAPLGNFDAAVAGVADANDIQGLIRAFQRAQGQ